MNDKTQGELLNKSGKGRYTNYDAPEKLIRYVTRTNGKNNADLIAWGGLGVTEFLGIEKIIDQFYSVQIIHNRKGNFGRYVDHDVYSFSIEEENFINANKLDVDKIARKMAYDFYERDKCQVVYGIHRSSKTDKHMHIHFAINTVNYITGKKRRENTRQTRERETLFQQIINVNVKTPAFTEASFSAIL